MKNPNKQRKILIVFDDMIADIMKNKKLQAIVKELFSRCRKLNISLILSLSLIFLSQKMSDQIQILFDYEKQQQIRIKKCYY